MSELLLEQNLNASVRVDNHRKLLILGTTTTPQNEETIKVSNLYTQNRQSQFFPTSLNQKYLVSKLEALYTYPKPYVNDSTQSYTNSFTISKWGYNRNSLRFMIQQPVKLRSQFLNRARITNNGFANTINFISR